MRFSGLGRIVGGLLLLLAVVFLSVANAPAPYWACDGKSRGDKCEPDSYTSGCTSGCLHHNPEGVCELATGCTDDPSTAVNECLWCAGD